MESMLKSPSLFKSGSREILFHPTADQKETRAPSMRSFELQEDPSFWKEHNVQVVIRVRPLSSSEISVQGHNRCIRQDSGQTITWSGHPESRFTFDHVADENVSQEILFKVAGVPMVENCVGGYNSCMFAYGQTGSGKTHTMLGDIEGGTRRHSENCGMTPRVFEHLFSRIQKEKESRREDKLRFTCRCSFLEIYNEQIIDLLDTTSNNLQIREDAKKGVYVENLKEVEVSCSRDVIQLLLQGATNRKVASTNMNLASSRSHSVFTCVIESKWECQGVMHHRFARLNLVDLAGSERQKSSGAEGERLKEATNINKSLSTLGLVIMNLVNISNGKSMHVPYRDSKLTFLLQDSLGGNSKTTIIANISPSSCCAQETLSTLKFAQRAKFIRNNAIVNEDASGDVITMRLQIQQLKKEVSHLQSLVNGASLNKESDNCSVSFPGSPGSFKWDTGMGSLSPLTSDKKFSQRKDEAALVGVLRREQEKDLAMKALAAEKEAALQLAKQREEEIQGLKMRLRLRESGIKRMEAVASGKMSAESHLLQEKNELLREIAILRGQVDRNQEVTRFAMENLQMKEEIRRLKSFYEEGEREIMSEQIQLLENKLLDALDWKLMYEKDLTEVEKDSLELGRLDEDNLLFSSQEPSSSWNSSINGEMEFLHLQAIQNQREVEVLRKNLNNCLEVKEKLERRVDELVNELEEERKSVNALKEASQFPQIDCPTTSRTDDSIIAAVDDQMELKTMVEAIAAASEREAEAHEIAIILAKENDELRSKDLELSHQLQDMNEEIENLRGYYEKAMQERDDLRRRLCSIKEANNAKVNEINCPEKLVEEDEDGVCSNEKGMMASKVCSEFVESQILAEKLVISGLTELDSIRMDEDQSIPVGQPINFVEASKEELNSARDKLDVAEDKLLHAAKAISFFGLLEKATADAYTISEKLEATEINIQSKRREIETLKCLSSEMIERKAAANNKLSALKSVLPSFCSVDYWEQREAQAREKVHASSLVVKQKEAHFTDLQVRKKGISSALTNARQTEGTLRNSLDSVKSKLCEFEMRRKETEKVLFDRNQVDEPVPKSLHLGKAGDLLKSEEERSKLSAEKATLREKLVVVQKEISKLSWSYNTLETEIQGIDKEMHEASNSLKASQCGLDRVIEEKKVLMEMRTEGKSESEKLIVECVQCVFEADLKEGEVGICEDELEFDLRRLKELKERLSFINQKNNSLWEERPIAEKLVEEFGDVQRSIFEAKSSLFAITDR